MKYLVSSCLMGDNCKYNGKNNYDPKIIEFLKDKEYIKVCPECLGGLPTPRVPAEIVNNKVINKNNVDVTNEYELGAKRTLEIAQNNKCSCAILKSRSPSCGCGEIYDGTFSNTLVKKDGITTRLLKENNIKVVSNEEINLLMDGDNNE